MVSGRGKRQSRLTTTPRRTCVWSGAAATSLRENPACGVFGFVADQQLCSPIVYPKFSSLSRPGTRCSHSGSPTWVRISSLSEPREAGGAPVQTACASLHLSFSTSYTSTLCVAPRAGCPRGAGTSAQPHPRLESPAQAVRRPVAPSARTAPSPAWVPVQAAILPHTTPYSCLQYSRKNLFGVSVSVTHSTPDGSFNTRACEAYTAGRHVQYATPECPRTALTARRGRPVPPAQPPAFLTQCVPQCGYLR